MSRDSPKTIVSITLGFKILGITLAYMHIRFINPDMNRGTQPEAQ